MVALGRALLRPARVLLLDEPSSAARPGESARIARVLAREKEGRILVTATRDRVLLEAADEVVVLREGRVIAQGAACAVLAALPPRNDIFEGTA